MKKRRNQILSTKPNYFSQGVQTLITLEDMEILIRGKKPLKSLLICGSGELENISATDIKEQLEHRSICHVNSSLSLVSRLRSRSNSSKNISEGKSKIKHTVVQGAFHTNYEDVKCFPNAELRCTNMQTSYQTLDSASGSLQEIDVDKNSSVQRVRVSSAKKQVQRERNNQSLKSNLDSDSLVQNERQVGVENFCHPPNQSVEKSENFRATGSRSLSKRKKLQKAGSPTENNINIVDFQGENNSDKDKSVQHSAEDNTKKHFMCIYCSKILSCKKSLKTHLWIHEREKEYTCENCGKKFLRANELCLHKRTHSGEKPHPCKSCDKAFKSSSALKRHLTVHNQDHEEERLETSGHGCTVCGKIFSQKGNLTVHMKIHTRTYDHKCSTCSKSFISGGDLKRHLRVHSKEKPYTCHTCSKSFTTSSSLVCHMRLHSGERPYLCGVCGVSFSVLSHLKQHNKIHARGDLCPRKRMKCMTKDCSNSGGNPSQNDDITDAPGSTGQSSNVGSAGIECSVAKETLPMELNVLQLSNTNMDCNDLDINCSLSSVSVIDVSRTTLLIGNNTQLSSRMCSGDIQDATMSGTQSVTHLSETPTNLVASSSNESLILEPDVITQEDASRYDNLLTGPVSATPQGNIFPAAQSNFSQCSWNFPITKSGSSIQPVLSTEDQIIYTGQHCVSVEENRNSCSTISTSVAGKLNFSLVPTNPELCVFDVQCTDSKEGERVYRDKVNVTSTGKISEISASSQSLTNNDSDPMSSSNFKISQVDDSCTSHGLVTPNSESNPHSSHNKLSFSVSNIIGTELFTESQSAWKPMIPATCIVAEVNPVINTVHKPSTQTSTYLNSVSNHPLGSSKSYTELQAIPSQSFSNVQNNTDVRDASKGVNSPLIPQNVQSLYPKTAYQVSKVLGANSVSPVAPPGQIKDTDFHSPGPSIFTGAYHSLESDSNNVPVTSKEINTVTFSNSDVYSNAQTVGTLKSPMLSTNVLFTKSLDDGQSIPCEDSLAAVSLDTVNP